MYNNSAVTDLLKRRRSVRKYTDAEVSSEEVEAILDCARFAPSGLNNQPWRFLVIRDRDIIERLSKLSHSKTALLSSRVIIACYLSRDKMYNETKDIQSAGACMQNILLACCGLGLGACWIGDIINNTDEADEILGVGEDKMLMGVITIGRPESSPDNEGDRFELKEFIMRGSQI